MILQRFITAWSWCEGSLWAASAVLTSNRYRTFRSVDLHHLQYKSLEVWHEIRVSVSFGAKRLAESCTMRWCLCHLASRSWLPENLPPAPQRTNPYIQFTMERDSESKNVFLDVQLEREEEPQLWRLSSARRHTDRYSHFNYHCHPAKVFRGAVQCLRDKAEKVCSGEKQWQEVQHLRQVFTANDYPKPVVKNNLRGRTTLTNTTVENKIPPKLLHSPYAKWVSERIEKTCRLLRVKTATSLRRTLRISLVKA